LGSRCLGCIFRGVGSASQYVPFVPLLCLPLLTAVPERRQHIHKRAPAPEPALVTVYNDVATVWVDQNGNTVDPHSPRTITVTVTGARGAAATVTSYSKTPSVVNQGYTAYTTTSSASTKAVRSSKKKKATSGTSSKIVVDPTTTSTISKAAATASSSKAVVQSNSPVNSRAAAATGSYVSGTYPAGGGRKPGIVYSPYNADSTCKTKDQVDADFEKLQHFSPIRLYGVDCNQTEFVISAAKRYGIKVMPAIYNMNAPLAELETLIKAVNGDWDMVHTVAIGNEVVNFGKKTADEYARIINACRDRLRKPDVGYTGPVVGADTFVAIMSNPAICEASDYVAANAHPYFDGAVLPENAGTWLDSMKAAVKAKCGNKAVVITGKLHKTHKTVAQC
jgi:exo-beta-1,3-glucanase (GH17 family)